MDRRDFIGSCTAGVACLSSFASAPVFAAHTEPKPYASAVLVNERGDPVRASSLQARTNYVFHYPYVATPVFLLDLGRPVLPQSLSTQEHDEYAWPGGVGPGRSIVAFSAICAHRLVYPTREVTFISFRTDRARAGVRENLIHCCSENSQYDPALGARVLSGPARQPLCAVLLKHDAKADTLAAYATLGGELFDEFFRKYELKLSLEVGPRAHDYINGSTVVQELERFCRNPIRC